MITRSALVVLHIFTSAERVLNVGRVLVKLQWKHGIQNTHTQIIARKFCGIMDLYKILAKELIKKASKATDASKEIASLTGFKKNEIYKELL